MLDQELMERAADDCENCATVCRQAIDYCLQRGGEHAEANNIRLLMDCVEICQATANFIHRGSHVHRYISQACAEICTRCAQDCRRFQDEVLDHCADLCDRCGQVCEEIAKSGFANSHEVAHVSAPPH